MLSASLFTFFLGNTKHKKWAQNKQRDSDSVQILCENKGDCVGAKTKNNIGGTIR